METISDDTMALLSFVQSLAATIKLIEREQPEPGFQEVFVGLLDKHLEAAVSNDEAEGLNTRETVQNMRTMLSQNLAVGKIIDAMQSDP